jgi:hypothetical protein
MDEDPKSESPAGAGLIAEQAKTESTVIVPHDGDDRNTAKSLATLKARFALAGHVVHELAEGGVLVVRPAWNVVRHYRDLNELRAFAHMVGIEA